MNEYIVDQDWVLKYKDWVLAQPDKAQITMFTRIALTFTDTGPDLFAIMQVLGPEVVKERMNRMASVCQALIRQKARWDNWVSQIESSS